MKVQKIKLSPCDFSWLVLDDNHLPIKPITDFIRYLNNVDKSPCTVRSYANHLKLFWEFLSEKQIQWSRINLANLASFVGWLRNINSTNQVIDLHVKYRIDNLNEVRNKTGLMNMYSLTLIPMSRSVIQQSKNYLVFSVKNVAFIFVHTCFVIRMLHR